MSESHVRSQRFADLAAESQHGIRPPRDQPGFERAFTLPRKSYHDIGAQPHPGDPFHDPFGG